MRPKPEDFDFAMSDDYRRFTNDTKLVRGLKTQKPKTIKVSGIKLHNISAGDRIDETNHEQLEENFRKLGILPNTEKSPEIPQGSAVPAEAPKTKPVLKGGKPINPPWHGDPEPSIAITTDPDKRRRALNSDTGHDATLQRQQRRKERGLPEKAPPWKDLQRDFLALTPDQINFLREIGFHPERVTNPHSETVELMLLRLKQYGKL